MFGFVWDLYTDSIADRIIKGIYNLIVACKGMLMTENHQHSKVIPLESNRGKYIEEKLPEEILRTYGDSLLRLAVSYLKNLSDGEDILQDTLIKYIEKRPKFKSEEHEKAWLLRVAGNLSKNRIKYNKTRLSSQLDEGLIGENSPELNYVWEAVMALPSKYREVIHLFYHEGYSTGEISKILAKKESTIRSLLHRGRKILKDTLREEYDFDE